MHDAPDSGPRVFELAVGLALALTWSRMPADLAAGTWFALIALAVVADRERYTEPPVARAIRSPGRTDR